MRGIVFVPGDKDSQAGRMPRQEVVSIWQLKPTEGALERKGA
jgi:hypothetical protein